MADRTEEIGAIWAEGAPDVPASPVAGVTYANAGLLPTTIAQAWQYKQKADGSVFNEMMRRITTLMIYLEQQGVLPWCGTTNYAAGALCMGSDNNVYKALAANVGQTPVSYPASWESLIKSEIPSGSRMVFVQASAPTGWSKVTGMDGRGLRLTDGSGGATGGSSDAFAAHSHTGPSHTHGDTFAVQGHILTVAEMPSHTHPVGFRTNANGSGNIAGQDAGAYSNYQNTESTGGDGSHSHAISGAVSAGGTGSTGNFAPKYINSIVCQKA